ncbi:WXG100 family type VII secretion target, partial [Streptomyces mirabilis]|uniref:WXG100 family type VII secretion target n=1 Tax=Streptomyces mirabilis TaxID=68239 RepID=UPI0033C29C72
MADGKKSSDVPGFSEGEDGVWVKEGDTSGDYSSWDWKHIMAAINGGAAYVVDSHTQERTSEISDPETLQEAANTFFYTQQVLQEVAQALKDQTEQLTGENGPWQGEAASTLKTAMTGLSTQVQHMSDALSGGVTGDYNVPQQMADNAQHLREAKAKINDINNWYAQQALAINPHLLMSNGLVRVSANKKIVEMMGNDMRKVLVALSQHYKVTSGSVSQPTSPDNPANSPYDNMPYSGDGMPYTGGGIPNYGDGMPYTGGGIPNYGDGMPYTGGGIPNYGGKSPQDVADPTDYPNAGLAPGTGTLDPTAPGFSPNATDLGGPGSTSGGPGLRNASVSPAPFDASDLGSGAPLDNGPGVSPNGFPGDPSLGGDPANMPSTGQLDPTMDAALNPNGQGTGSPMPEVAPFPGLAGGLNSPGTGNTGTKSRTLDAPSAFPKNLGLDAPGVTGPDSATAPGTADIAGFPDTSLPDVNTKGIAAPGTGVGDGLPGLSDMPTEARVPGEGVSAFPGSTALDGAGGTPMMPMMPMGGMGGMGAGGGAGGQEGAPSDASGLLGGHVTPWAGSSDLGGDTPGEVTGGVGAGGPGLHLPGGEDLVAPGLPGGSADVAGFPSTGVGDGLPGLSDMPTEARVPGEGVSAFPGSTA